VIIGADETHTLCSRCWRDERNREQAHELRQNEGPR
jgi:hypothetical protein